MVEQNKEANLQRFQACPSLAHPFSLKPLAGGIVRTCIDLANLADLGMGVTEAEKFSLGPNSQAHSYLQNVFRVVLPPASEINL